MTRRLGAVIFIYACTAGAWMILARTVDVRTGRQDAKLKGDVGRLWGTSQTQEALPD